MPHAGPYEPLLDRFADYLRVVRNLAPSTTGNYRHYVACFLAWWHDQCPDAGLAPVRARHLAADPSATLSPPRRNPHRVEVYSPADAAAILAHTATLTDLRGRQRHAIVATFRYTGARAGEVSGLRLDRVDLEGRRIEVLGKGSRHRTIALTEQLTDVLDTFLREVRLAAEGAAIPSPFPATTAHAPGSDARSMYTPWRENSMGVVLRTSA